MSLRPAGSGPRNRVPVPTDSAGLYAVPDVHDDASVDSTGAGFAARTHPPAHVPQPTAVLTVLPYDHSVGSNCQGATGREGSSKSFYINVEIEEVLPCKPVTFAYLICNINSDGVQCTNQIDPLPGAASGGATSSAGYCLLANLNRGTSCQLLLRPHSAWKFRVSDKWHVRQGTVP